MEDRLAATLPDVHDDAVVVETLVFCGLRDELEHALCFLGGELADLTKARNVPLGDD
jgi:hypothetical protein